MLLAVLEHVVLTSCSVTSSACDCLVICIIKLFAMFVVIAIYIISYHDHIGFLKSLACNTAYQ